VHNNKRTHQTCEVDSVSYSPAARPAGIITSSTISKLFGPSDVIHFSKLSFRITARKFSDLRVCTGQCTMGLEFLHSPEHRHVIAEGLPITRTQCEINTSGFSTTPPQVGNRTWQALAMSAHRSRRSSCG
jgi:hypothetical protein